MILRTGPRLAGARSGQAAALLLFALAFAAPAGAQELRALWVDAFHEGIRSPREADELVASARRAHLNTLIVQVRRRGDALYLKGIEPQLDDPAYDPSFDALGYIVEAGHRGGLKVHAWIAGAKRKAVVTVAAGRVTSAPLD